MKKLNKILIAIIIIQFIALFLLCYEYFLLKNTAKSNLDMILNGAEETSNLYKQINELEEKLESYEK